MNFYGRTYRAKNLAVNLDFKNGLYLVLVSMASERRRFFGVVRPTDLCPQHSKLVTNVSVVDKISNNLSVKKEGLHLREMAKMPSDVKQLDSEIDDVKRNWFKLTQLSSSFKNELENSLGSYFRSQMDYSRFRLMISRFTLSFSFVW